MAESRKGEGGALVRDTVLTRRHTPKSRTPTPSITPPALPRRNQFSYHSGTLTLELDGKNSSHFDQVNFGTTAVTGGGALVVSFINGFDYSQFTDTSKVFHLFDKGITFSSVVLPDSTQYGGLAWDTSHLASDGYIKISTAAVPEPATLALAALALAPAGLAWLKRARNSGKKPARQA